MGSRVSWAEGVIPVLTSASASASAAASALRSLHPHPDSDTVSCSGGRGGGWPRPWEAAPHLSPRWRWGGPSGLLPVQRGRGESGCRPSAPENEASIPGWRLPSAQDRPEAASAAHASSFSPAQPRATGGTESREARCPPPQSGSWRGRGGLTRCWDCSFRCCGAAAGPQAVSLLGRSPPPPG